MTKDEAIKMALDALEANVIGTSGRMPKTHAAITALREALDEPKQEPVAYINAVDDWAGFPKLIISDKPKEGFKPVYFAPPRRQWVGLTDEEIYGEGNNHEKVAKDGSGWFDRGSFARAISAKLKEKNHENHT